MWGHAELIDIIGNALADEAAELSAKLLRPNVETNNEANELDKLAFNICIRIGFVQARLWELFSDAPIYEALDATIPLPRTQTEVSESVLNNIGGKFYRRGRRMLGNVLL